MNWINNFRFFKVPYKSNPNLLVHEGFFDSYSSIKDQLFNSLMNITRSFPFTNEIVFTGHSHGAAISMFASIDVYDSNLFNKTHKISTINFGCPRVGNKEFANYFEKRIPLIRLTYANDIVVHLPPSFFDYHHPVMEVWEQKSRFYKRCSSIDGEDPSCSNSITEISFDDHLFYMGYHIKEGKC